MKRTITLIALVAALLIPGMAIAQHMPAKSGMKLSQFKAPASVNLRGEEEPIMDVPEGTLYDNMYASSFAYGLGWGDIYIQNVDGGIGKVVEGDDGNLYIYNPISQGYIWFSILPWIKAEPAGDGKYVVHLPQLYIIDVGDPYYAYCMHYDEDEGMPVVEEEGDIEFTWENGVLTQLGDKFIGLCDATADWFYMADQHIVYAPQNDEVTTLPEDMFVQSYTMTYLSDPSDLTQTKETVVSVAIDGEDIYMGNLNNNNPDSYIKGHLADGKATATFPTRQYLGPDAYYNGHIYVLTGEAYVDAETYSSPVFNYNLNDEIVFNVDEDARNIVGEWPAAMVTNVGPNTLSILNDYVAPGLAAFDEVPAVPATPVFTDEDVTVNSSAGWTVLHFTIPTVDVDGNKLNENKLYYNIYLDGEVFTFDPEDYIGLSSAMTNIPYKFEDNINFDIYISNGRHTVYLYTTDFEQVGVQSIYTAGDEENRSDIVYNLNPNVSGINEMASGARVIDTRYYDLTGRQLPTAPATGIYLKHVTYSDGTSTAVKVVK